LAIAQLKLLNRWEMGHGIGKGEEIMILLQKLEII
jgi:hypothetical protein